MCVECLLDFHAQVDHIEMETGDCNDIRSGERVNIGVPSRPDSWDEGILLRYAVFAPCPCTPLARGSLL